MLALIAGTVSYLHMHMLVELHGQPGWIARPLPERPPGDPRGISWHFRPRLRLHRHGDPILRPATGKKKGRPQERS